MPSRMHGSGTLALNEHRDSLILVLGGLVDALSQEQIITIWDITGTFVSNIYRKVLALRKGRG